MIIKSTFLSTILLWTSVVYAKDFRNELQINPVTTTSDPTVFNFNTIDDIPPGLLLNHDNVFQFNDKTILTHSKTLNTLEKTIGEYASLFGDNSENKWFQIESLGTGISVKGPSEAISPKLSVEKGDGGYVSITISKSYGKGMSLDIPHIIDMFPIYGGTIGVSSKHTNMFTISGTYKCVAAPGEVVQLMSAAHYNEYPGYKVREVVPIPGKKLIFIDTIEYQFSEWETHDQPVRVANKEKRPDLQCIDVSCLNDG